MNITDIDAKIIKKAKKENKNDFEISRQYEHEFFEDMKKLNVGLPEVITRASEYVPEIVAFIEGIIKNGFAYEANGSVYFDVMKYISDPKHTYAKLEPNFVETTTQVNEKEKKNEKDFTLWRKA